MENEKRLIYADEAIELINGLESLPREEETEELVNALTIVEAVEVVRGEWLDGSAVDHNGKKVYDSIDCSVCEEVFKIESHDREYWKARFKVCPFCGAIMDGERKDNE